METLIGTVLAIIGAAPLFCGLAILVGGMFTRPRSEREPALGLHATLVDC